MAHSLHAETVRFRRWALTQFPDNRSGEWECHYPGWDALYAAFAAHLDEASCDNADGAVVADLIYAIARDNECEYLVSIVARHPRWLSLLLPHVLASGEPDAKWQAAVALGDGALPRDQAEPALLRLVDDTDEYVSRRALGALGAMRSDQAERMCEHAWKSGHEYQRMMALDVLMAVGSPKLPHYLALAREDGRPFLLQAAARIAGPQKAAPGE